MARTRTPPRATRAQLVAHLRVRGWTPAAIRRGLRVPPGAVLDVAAVVADLAALQRTTEAGIWLALERAA